jgi:hypothetical protein
MHRGDHLPACGQQRRRSRGCPSLEPAPDDGNECTLPSRIHIGTLRSLVCPVSVTSCWVYAAHVSLGLNWPNGREHDEPLSRPCQNRQVELFDRWCFDTSNRSRVPAYARRRYWTMPNMCVENPADGELRAQKGGTRTSSVANANSRDG